MLRLERDSIARLLPLITPCAYVAKTFLPDHEWYLHKKEMLPDAQS